MFAPHVVVKGVEGVGGEGARLLTGEPVSIEPAPVRILSPVYIEQGYF